MRDKVHLEGADNFYDAFSDPVSNKRLRLSSGLGLMNESGTTYRFLDGDPLVVDFLGKDGLLDRPGSAFVPTYSSPESPDIYRNFLTWLFATFNEDEADFRKTALAGLGLRRGQKVLVVGCGLGDELPIIHGSVGSEGEIHAQDLSRTMVKEARTITTDYEVCFSVSDATSLPYTTRYFDAAYHFGGINLFSDVKKAIAEMERVCKIGGTVVFGDEGIAPHLRGSRYADIAISNNRLWATEAPMAQLPCNAVDIHLTYVLGNCFYLISFVPSDGYPKMNIDVEHKGLRGGSARTRYFGQLEGVSCNTKLKVLKEAKRRNTSVYSLLEEIINNNISDEK